MFLTVELGPWEGAQFSAPTSNRDFFSVSIYGTFWALIVTESRFYKPSKNPVKLRSVLFWGYISHLIIFFLWISCNGPDACSPPSSDSYGLTPGQSAIVGVVVVGIALAIIFGFCWKQKCCRRYVLANNFWINGILLQNVRKNCSRDREKLSWDL